MRAGSPQIFCLSYTSQWVVPAVGNNVWFFRCAQAKKKKPVAIQSWYSSTKATRCLTSCAGHWGAQILFSDITVFISALYNCYKTFVTMAVTENKGAEKHNKFCITHLFYVG